MVKFKSLRPPFSCDEICQLKRYLNQQINEEMLRNLQRITDEAVMNAWQTGILAGIEINYGLDYPEEQIWIVENDADIINIPTEAIEGTDPCSKPIGLNVPDGSVQIPDIFYALIHTHPTWAYAWPGYGDYTSAQNHPVYNINRSGSWVLREGSDRGSPPITLSGSNPSIPPAGRGERCR